jgi:RNA polymerase sigma-70 factor (ECF subfamily)
MGHHQFDEIYDRYKSAVYSFACYLTQDRGEADDLFQETWLRVARHFPKVLDMEKIKAWLFTITANLHKDALRKKRTRGRFLFHKKRETGLHQIFPEDEWDRTDPDVLDESEQVDLGLAIYRAMAKLPPKHRLIFVLKEIAGFKQDEIGGIIGMPLGTVKSLMHRAVKRLRQELADYRPGLNK